MAAKLDTAAAMSRRHAIIGLATLVSACTGAKVNKRAGARVLFVCQAGTVKSAIAREHTRRLALQRGLDLTVWSRGVSPADHMTPDLAAALARDTIDVASEPIRALQDSDLSSADIVVVFTDLPEQFSSARVRDWSDVPSMVADYKRARPILLARIEALLDELEGGVTISANQQTEN